MTTSEIIELEDQYQIPTYSKLPIALVRGSGSYVWDSDGNRYLDFYGGHCVTILGHSPPEVTRAISEQAGQLIFYSNVVYSPIRAQTAQLLASMAPEGLRRVFFCNSGTEANETALKLARKWTGKSGVVAMAAGFHGRTLGSLAVTSNEKYREPYLDVLPDTAFVPFGDSRAVEAVLSQSDDIAAVIVEPIQSMAGIMEAEPAYYRKLRSLCDTYGAALIFDEVQTGVGRTGTFSISEQYDLKPDLITLAKSLGSGIPVGAILASDAIADSVTLGDQGTTFGGGMVAMAAVHATLRTIRDRNYMDRATAIFQEIAGELQDSVRHVRGRGCLIGLHLDRPAKPVIAALRKSGILAAGSDHPDVIRLMPAINVTPEETGTFTDTFRKVIQSSASEISQPA